MVKCWLLIAFACLRAGLAIAQESEISLYHSGTDIKDRESLQRGARNFMNYCSGCHSLTYLRYNRMAQDLDIPESELSANLMFTSAKAFDDTRFAPSNSTTRCPFQCSCKSAAAVRPTSSVAIIGMGRSSGCR